MRRPAARAGFTLIEVLVVSVILGLLAGIATPRLGQAVHRAGAAKVVSDARTLSIATRSFLEDEGTLTPSEAPGVAPVALNRFLNEGMTFHFRDATYRFVTQPALDAAQLWVDYPAGSGLGGALQSFRRPGEVTWTPTRTTFVLAR